MKQVMTLLVSSVLMLVGGVMAPAMADVLPKAAAPTPIKIKPKKLILEKKTIKKPKTMPVTAIQKPSLNTTTPEIVTSSVANATVTEEQKWAAAIYVIRGTSLYDFQDGTRKDSMDYVFLPKYKTTFGAVSAKLLYSQNLKDSSPHASDFSDASVTVAKNPYGWEWSPPYILTLTPTLTTVLPLSQASIKRDQLQTAIIAGISFGIVPDAVSQESGWNLAVGLTAGRNFHSYEESFNGAIVLNRYSSNQTLNLGYTYEKFNLGIEYVHKTRWTYQNSVKDFFELSQELGYTINKQYNVAIGHTNAPLSGLNANGSEPSFNLINENDSTVYAQLGIVF